MINFTPKRKYNEIYQHLAINEDAIKAQRSISFSTNLFIYSTVGSLLIFVIVNLCIL